ncbi:MAG: DUF4038 domain-containing protein [Chloroflexi bacterium]|nr:DUF4038 domain-containing protein [Chloroflexota bacterium]
MIKKTFVLLMVLLTLTLTSVSAASNLIIDESKILGVYDNGSGNLLLAQKVELAQTTNLLPNAAAAPVISTTILAINSGGGVAGNFVADKNFVGGNTYSTNAAIVTTGVTNPAPQVVYQSERWSGSTYTLPGLIPGASYTVRLHFAEMYFTAANRRKFNVAINGAQVLSEFDVFAAAGAANKAVIREFAVVANSSGQIIVTISNGSLDNAKINGIEVVGGTIAPTNTPTNTPPPTSTPTFTRTPTAGATSTHTPTTPPTNTPTFTRTPTIAPIPTNTPIPGSSAAYPLKASANKRYLVDQNNVPFLMVGDAVWSLIAQVSNEDAIYYLNNRQSKGFNTAIVELIEHRYATNAPRNFYGVAPFAGAPFTTPNESYFLHADYVISAAAQRGINILLDPLYLGYQCNADGWCAEVQAATIANMQAWGMYVGNRYKNFPNIVWMIGGDVDPNYAAGVKAKVDAFAVALKQADPNHLITAHNQSESMAITPWSGVSWLNVNNTYFSIITTSCALM